MNYLLLENTCQSGKDYKEIRKDTSIFVLIILLELTTHYLLVSLSNFFSLSEFFFSPIGYPPVIHSSIRKIFIYFRNQCPVGNFYKTFLKL